MNKTLSMIAIASTVLLLNACAKEEAAPAPETAPAATPAPAAEPAPAKVEAGGYVPTEAERRPGVTIDPAKLAEEEKAAIEAAQKAADAIPAPVVAAE